MSFRIKTGRGRPRTKDIVRNTTIYLYRPYEKVYKMAVELANMEGKSFSELVSRSLKEYVERHYPGNPQTALKSFEEFEDERVRPMRIEAEAAAREIRKRLEFVEEYNPSKLEPLEIWLRESKQEEWERIYKVRRESVIQDLPRHVVKLARLNRIVQSDEYDGLIEKFEKILFEAEGKE